MKRIKKEMVAKKYQNKDGTPKEIAFNEVEKQFYISQISDLNQKVARLKTLVDEYQTKSDHFQKVYDKLDEDRAGIISYLNKTIKTKNEECEELREKVKLLEETRNQETVQFKASLANSETQFRQMKDHYISENKLLSSKINTLEEFRMQRELLMTKFEAQEKLMQDQEMKHKRIIYDTEKKITIDKDKLKKEMEARLMDLAQTFQEATELRIAASTHRVIRENIVINNEMNSMMCNKSKLSTINANYDKMRKAALIAKEIAEEERDETINKNLILQKVINKLTTVIQSSKDEIALKKQILVELESAEEQNEILSKNIFYLNMRIRELEEQHAKILGDHNQSYANISKFYAENLKLKKILAEAAAAAAAGVMKLDNWSTDSTHRSAQQQQIFEDLHNIVSQRRDIDEMSIDISERHINYSHFKKKYVKKVRKSKSVLQPIPCHKTIDHDEDSLQSGQYSSTIRSSITTCPSLKIVPPFSKQELIIEDSIPSFNRSFHSSDTSEKTVETLDKDDTEGISTMNKLLVASEIEVKKSMMLDLIQSGYTKSYTRKTDSLISETQSRKESVKSKDEISDKDIQEKSAIEENLCDAVEIKGRIHNLDKLKLDEILIEENIQKENV